MLSGLFLARPARGHHGVVGASSSSAAAPRGTLPNMLAILTTLLEIALGLRHLHALQLVHADLKPANILLKARWVWRLVRLLVM